jgi:hypothetical protein
MSSSICRHLRSNVIGYLALFMALTGITYAAGLPKNSVKSKQIKDGQVKNADLAVGAVDASKVAGDSLGGDQINESALGQVPSARQADHAASADQATTATNSANADHATAADNSQQLGGQSPAAFQQRVTGTCSGGQSVQSIAADGQVGCGAAAGSGTVTNVASGTGLSGGPITSTGTLSVTPAFRLPQGCTSNQVAKSNGAGVWNCAADTDTNTTYSARANGGLTLGSTAFSLAPCATGQVLKATSAIDWACAADSSGGSPSGAAGGDLSGTYPNPQIAANAVGSGEVADNSLTGTDINESTLVLPTTDAYYVVGGPGQQFGLAAGASRDVESHALPAGNYTLAAGLGVSGASENSVDCYFTVGGGVRITTAGVSFNAQGSSETIPLIAAVTLNAPGTIHVFCDANGGNQGETFFNNWTLVATRVSSIS